MEAFYENANHEFYCRDTTRGCGSLGFRSHLHYQIELAFIFEGRTLITVDSSEYEVSGGDAFIVFPNQIHTFTTVERENYILLKITPEFIPELLPLFTSSLPRSNILRGAANDKYLAGLLREISAVYHGQEPFRENILKGYALAFLSKLLQKTELSDAQCGDYHVIGSIMNYCSENYDKPLSLNVLAHDLHLNKYYISHIMGNKLNIGFNDYINSLRVSAACKMLVNTDKTVTEISEAVGFNTLRTFNRAFSKHMECTPSQYRQKKKTGEQIAYR